MVAGRAGRCLLWNFSDVLHLAACPVILFVFGGNNYFLSVSNNVFIYISRENVPDMVQKKPYLIALLTPVGMGMHGQVMSGIMGSAPVRNDLFRVYHFFTRGISEDAIRHTLDQISELRFAALITIGASCARVAKKVLEEKGMRMPHIFVGVNDPISAGIVDTADDLIAHNMTGILYDSVQTDKVAQFLYEAKPHMKSLLIASEGISSQVTGGPANWVAAEAEIIRSICEPRGVSVMMHYAATLGALYNYVYKNSDQYDTLLMIEGGICLNLYESLGVLCNQKNKTLFSGLIEPVSRSAALGYGSSYESLGEHAIEYAYKLLIEGVALRSLPPYTDSKGRHAAVNIALAPLQDLDPGHIEKVCRQWGGVVFGCIL
jgi:ABC-type uncharacterized transport system substrate-binding protein